MLAKIKKDIIEILIPRVVSQLPSHLQSLFDDRITYHINPTGKFVIGGPHGDTGLTGRKIIVDTCGGKGAHGGGAFGGKDPSKVDDLRPMRLSGIAKNLVAAGAAKSIGSVELCHWGCSTTSVYINTYGTNQTLLSDAELASKIQILFDLTPYKLNLFKT